MHKKILLPIILSSIIGPIVGCNSDDPDPMEYVESSSVIVSGFSLSNDKNVLDSLKNVFFSINLEKGQIFNADSLPFGTKINRLVANITAPSTASEVNLKYYDTKTMRDTTINYKENSTDSIDFSHGPAILTVKSQSGLVTKEYTIKVNVHKVKADSLAWYSMHQAPLPSIFSELDAQGTAKLGDKFFCFSTDGVSYSLSTTTNPLDPQWETFDVELQFIPNVESLRASNDALFMLSTDNYLYTSADGISWTQTGEKWINIYGPYNEQIIGAQSGANGYDIVEYPSGRKWNMPDGFPLTGTSQTACYSTEMGYEPQLVMIGGRTADGKLTNGSWSFDGSDWANVSSIPIPIGLEYVSMVPYFLVEVPNTTWSPENYPVLLAIGGRDSDGKINDIVYYSRDWGLTWRQAPELVQLPEGFPVPYGASAFQFSSTMHVESRAYGWKELPVRTLPINAQFMTTWSRSDVTFISEWQCPSIYLFGGHDASGKTLNQMWRGVIYYFTFKPIQ